MKSPKGGGTGGARVRVRVTLRANIRLLCSLSCQPPPPPPDRISVPLPLKTPMYFEYTQYSQTILLFLASDITLQCTWVRKNGTGESGWVSSRRLTVKLRTMLRSMS